LGLDWLLLVTTGPASNEGNRAVERPGWGEGHRSGDRQSISSGRGRRELDGAARPFGLATTVVGVDLNQALRTTGAVRDFRPAEISDDTVYRLLDTARFAPNGGNRQAWRVIVVKNPAVRRAVRDAYLPGWYEYLAQVAAGLTPWAAVTDRELERRAIADAPEVARAAAEGPGGFAEHFDQVPAMLVLLADLAKLASVDRDAGRYTLVGGASIYPFAWSILLAARAEGLAGVMTTMVVRNEPSVREVLGLPSTVVVAGVLALGHPVRQPTRLRREPVESFATVDRFDGRPLGSS
jgi:nitroreductase